MSNRDQSYRGNVGRQQWGNGGGRNPRYQTHQGSYGQQDPSRDEHTNQQQAWPRQQQLPNNHQGSWNRHNDDDRHRSPGPQQRSQQGWQKNENRRQLPANPRNSQRQQQQQRPPPQQPREFKPPPPRPNAWGDAPAAPTQQPQPQNTLVETSPSVQQSKKPPPPNGIVTPEAPASKGTENVPGAMGAWSAKLNAKKSNSAAPADKGPARGQTVAPMILKPDSAAPPSKKPKNKHPANKKDGSKASSNNNANNSCNMKIHGKKPKLSSISMGDLVPNIKKILPKDKNKKNANQATQAQRLSTSATTLAAVAASSGFPALPTTSNWPSLAAAKPPPKPATTPAATAKKAAPPKHTKSNTNNNNDNNNNQSKKRKNQSQQQKGGAKTKSGSHTGNNNKLMTKPDANHLAASFLLPPGKSLDPNHLQAQFRPAGTSGGEHDLMRMMQGGQVAKGRQRIKPRKKQFSALKRKILLERLRVWKELHPEENDEKNRGKGGSEASCTICVYGFASLEEVVDPDEYEELLENLKEMADRMGKVKTAFIPRTPMEEVESGSSEHPTFVRFSTTAEAMAARGVWDGLVIGGQSLKVRSLPISASVENAMDGAEAEDAWQEACLAAERSDQDETMSDLDASACRILLKDVLTEDDLEDDECFSESIQDIKVLVEKFGVVEDIQANKQEGSTDVVIVYKGDQGVAQRAAEELQKLALGGSQICAELLCLNPAGSRPTKLLLENVLTEDDLEDEECLEESLNDVRSLLEKFGTVSSLDVTGTQILVSFSGMAAEALQGVAKGLNGTCLGGQTVKASAILESPSTTDELCVMLRNLLAQDDMDDDECLVESLEDVRELARQYGTVRDIGVERAADVSSSVVKVTYSTVAEAELATKRFDGMLVGGETISASVSLNASRLDGAGTVVSDNDDKTPPDEGDPRPMFSGDKRIPERFAACKRVPKVPGSGKPRNYAILTNNDTSKPLLTEMLNELMRLQLRALHDKNAKNAKARRRIVMGLREVARGIRANKVKMVVMANNLDEYGAIDDKLQEILDLAAEKDIPVLFELSKRVLGKALGKKIKVSVAAIQATDGAHQSFVKLAALAPHLEKPPSSVE